MPKKIIPSGFGLFMKELQKDKFEDEGVRIPLSQMKNFADPLWLNLPAEVKADFNEKAKQMKKNGTERLASDGTSIQQNLADEEEEERQEREMIIDIRNHFSINDNDPEGYKGFGACQKINIMFFNILCCANGEFIPLEVSIAKYSIKKGLYANFHRFINPGRCPTGFMGEAKRISDESHAIPFTSHDNAERDFKKLVRDMEAFLEIGKDCQFPPIFITLERMPQTLGCLKWLASKTGCDDRFRVWELGRLLYELRGAAGKSIVSLLLARDMLQGSSFDYQIDSRCDFHENLDSRYCALGIVRRLCFLLSDALCDAYDIEVHSHHLPPIALEEKHYEIQYPNVSSSFRPPKTVQQKRATPLDTLEGFSDEEEDGAYGISNLALNAPAQALGQGMGRGRGAGIF